MGETGRRGVRRRDTRERIKATCHKPRAGSPVDADTPGCSEVKLGTNHQRETAEEGCGARQAAGTRHHVPGDELRPDRQCHRLAEDRNEQQQKKAVAERLSGVVGAEEDDPPGSIPAPLEPRTPARADRDERTDADQREISHQCAAGSGEVPEAGLAMR